MAEEEEGERGMSDVAELMNLVARMAVNGTARDGEPWPQIAALRDRLDGAQQWCEARP
jgi:hypothetical protein